MHSDEIDASGDFGYFRISHELSIWKSGPTNIFLSLGQLKSEPRSVGQYFSPWLSVERKFLAQVQASTILPVLNGGIEVPSFSNLRNQDLVAATNTAKFRVRCSLSYPRYAHNPSIEASFKSSSTKDMMFVISLRLVDKTGFSGSRNMALHLPSKVIFTQVSSSRSCWIAGPFLSNRHFFFVLRKNSQATAFETILLWRRQGRKHSHSWYDWTFVHLRDRDISARYRSENFCLFIPWTVRRCAALARFQTVPPRLTIEIWTLWKLAKWMNICRDKFGECFIWRGSLFI